MSPPLLEYCWQSHESRDFAEAAAIPGRHCRPGVQAPPESLTALHYSRALAGPVGAFVDLASYLMSDDGVMRLDETLHPVDPEPIVLLVTVVETSAESV